MHQMLFFQGVFLLWGCVASVIAKDLYKILDVSPGASTADIKRAYRRLSMKYHPDRSKGNAEAEERFAEISEAYEILSGSSSRADYDRLGYAGYKAHAAAESGGGGGFRDFFDFFVGPRGRSKGGRHAHSDELPKAPISRFMLPITLEQAYFGDLLQVSFHRPVLCLRVDECYENRASCSGPGVATITQAFGGGFILQNQVADDSCVEHGRAWRSGCSACPKGPTELHRSRTSIFLDRGASDGTKITFENGGTQRLGHQPGDIEFSVRELPHRLFERRGEDLHSNIYLTLTEALVGFERTVPHVSRRPLQIVQTGVTHDQSRQVFSGKGMPRREGSGFGDLIVTYHVQYPLELTAKQRDLIREALANVTTWKFETPVFQ